MSKAATPQVKATEPTAIAPATPAPTTVWHEPFTALRRFSDEIDRMFSAFGFRRGLAFPDLGTFEVPKDFEEMTKAVWSPQVELLERDDKLVVRADLPGMKKEDIAVAIESDLLTIKGERKNEREEKNEKFFRSERSYGSFYRSFRLPKGIDPAKVTAVFKDGVLELTMPAPTRPEPTAHTIDVLEEKAG
jgi:HSP20 family protein